MAASSSSVCGPHKALIKEDDGSVYNLKNADTSVQYLGVLLSFSPAQSSASTLLRDTLLRTSASRFVLQ